MIHVGFIVAICALILCALVMVGSVVIGILAEKSGLGDGSALPVGAAIFVCALLIGAAVLWGIYPFDMQYHKYIPVNGTVTKVNTRLYQQTDNFVVTINGKYYRCDDSRCATLREGSHVKLLCSRVWQYASDDGWVCNWNGR